MYNVHLFIDNKLIAKRRMAHIFNTGDTVRFADEKYGKVTEVIWCLDEDHIDGTRVNIRIESE